MTYMLSTYCGDQEYYINATGDCCKGDQVRFERATFSGSYRKPKFKAFEMITGVIINDSYGKKKQQHTFTILLSGSDEKILIKGRNLYKNGVWRKKWDNEEERKIVLDEKHERGTIARLERTKRRIEEGYYDQHDDYDEYF